MNHEKRRLSQSNDEEINKSEERYGKRTKLIADIEDLSNELFCEIFDYLDGCDMYTAFSNLNTRFQCLITSSSVLLKIKFSNQLDSEVQSYCKQVIIPNRHRIISLHLCNEILINTFLTQCTIDSTFDRLESIVFCGVEANKIIQILFGLTSLLHLHSLTIVILDFLENLHDIYQFIFALPLLRYFKLFLYQDRPVQLLPTTTPDRFSNIENLVADHSCTLHELIDIIAYTPRLSHLTCDKLLHPIENIGREISITLSNLKYINIYRCYLPFDVLELFIEKISSQLRVLCILASSDENYLDANRWERLILKRIPHLSKFNLRHHGRIGNDFEPDLYRERIERFTSPFWIQRQWVFEVIIDIEEPGILDGSFSIRIQKKNKQEFDKPTENITYSKRDSTLNLARYRSISNGEEMDTYSIQYCLDMILTVNSFNHNQTGRPLNGLVITLLSALQFTHLIINNSRMSIISLIELIHNFHSIDSLTICFLPQLIPRCLSVEEEKRLRFVSNNNKTTKVILTQMTELAQVAFLIDICPCIQYLQIGCSSAIDLSLLLRLILMGNMKRTKYLASICLHIPRVNDQMVKELQRMIDLEKLLHNYTIEYSNNIINLRWE